MKVLVLGPYCEPIQQALESYGDKAILYNGPPDLMPLDADAVVAFGYRHIISGGILEHYKDSALNIHMSYLPWNKGADPNFWSWHDDTKKGVTIHAIDAWIDTGPIVARFEAPPKTFNAATTLRSSWLFLYHAACVMFQIKWGDIRVGRISFKPQEPYGSSHKTKDLPAWFDRNWDTLVSEVARKGGQSRLMDKLIADSQDEPN